MKLSLHEQKILDIIKESLSKSIDDSFSVADTLSTTLREARESFEKEYLCIHTFCRDLS